MENYALRLQQEHHDMRQNVQFLAEASQGRPQPQGCPIDPWMPAAQELRPEMRGIRDFFAGQTPQDTVEQLSRGPVGAQGPEQDMRRFFSHNPFETCADFGTSVVCSRPRKWIPLE